VSFDDATRKKKNAAAKMALKAASVPTKTGDARWVGFAFSPGKSKTDHIFLADIRKKGTDLMKEIKRLDPKRKDMCWGVATVSQDGKKVMTVKYIKKLSGVERKMQDALMEAKIRHLVKPHKKSDEEADDGDMAEAMALEDAIDPNAEDVAADDKDDDGPPAPGRKEYNAEDDPPLNLTARDAGIYDDEEEELADDEEEDEDYEEEDEDEEDDDQDEQTAGEIDEVEQKWASKLGSLQKAPEVWKSTRGVMTSSLDKLKAAIKAEYGNEAPALLAEVEKSMGKIDDILSKLDHSLSDKLERAHKATDLKERNAEITAAKAILKEHISYIQTEPLIAHIDSNPFGVQTNLKALLTKSLTHVAKVVS
jgi:hypothetical protein